MELTLNELINMIGTTEKAPRTPSPRKLRETAGEPIITMEGCIVYSNGYAVYECDEGITVMWLADCTTFTYQFVKNREGDECEEKVTIKDFGVLPWYWAVMVRGGHKIEFNNMLHLANRTIVKTDQDSEDDKNIKYSWNAGAKYENPEDSFIRKETIREALEVLTDRQREVFILYWEHGYTVEEIGEKMGISHQAVSNLLKKAKTAFQREKKQILIEDI